MLEDLATDTQFWSDVRARFIKRVEPLFVELYFAGVRGGLKIGQRLGRKDLEDDFIELTKDPTFAAKQAMFMTTFTNSWWQTLDKSTRRDLSKTLQNARENGSTLKEIKKAIEPIFGRARAERIAVTETTRLFGAGAQASYEAMGVADWEWRNSEDARVCAACDAMAAGGPYPMTQSFAPNHVSCRCWPVPTVSPTREVVNAQS